MSKNRGYRTNIQPVDEAVPEEVKEEVQEVIEESSLLEEDTNKVEATVEEEQLVTETIGMVTNCIKLNIRESADKHTKSIGLLNKGATVSILTDEPAPAGWYKIQTRMHDGIIGYCMSDYIEKIN